MDITCITCKQRIDTGDYRLIGVEHGSWASMYAHRGNCEDEARRLHAPKKPSARPRARASAPPPAPPAEVEELTMEEPEPLPDDGLPWFGMERRR